MHKIIAFQQNFSQANSIGEKLYFFIKLETTRCDDVKKCCCVNIFFEHNLRAARSFALRTESFSLDGCKLHTYISARVLFTKKLLVMGG